MQVLSLKHAMKYRFFKSIDGLFESKLKYKELKHEELSDSKKIFFKRVSILGKGNSISSLPYCKKSNLVNLKINSKINFTKNNKLIIVSGNTEVYKIHNYLINKKFFFPSFPSYPNATIGACIANCTHGISPRFGVIKDFIEEITLYNPNFGTKILSKKKNKKLFELTFGGMGLTGLILTAKLKVFKLKSSFIIIKKKRKFDDIKSLHIFLKNNNYIYNQNNLFLDFKKNITSSVLSGNFNKKDFSKKLINIKKIKKFRFGILKYSILRKLLEKIIIFREYLLNQKKIHINQAFFPSNAKLLYFNLMPKKFMEHQTIIPHKNVENFFIELNKIFLHYSPIITLGHMKIFDGKGQFLQFNGKGLALTLHFIINKNFKNFYKKFLDINLKYSCKPNLYKNSLIKIDDIKKFYKKDYYRFVKEIKKMNKKFIFENRLFNKENFYNRSL